VSNSEGEEIFLRKTAAAWRRSEISMKRRKKQKSGEIKWRRPRRKRKEGGDTAKAGSKAKREARRKSAGGLC